MHQTAHNLTPTYDAYFLGINRQTLCEYPHTTTRIPSQSSHYTRPFHYIRHLSSSSSISCSYHTSFDLWIFLFLSHGKSNCSVHHEQAHGILLTTALSTLSSGSHLILYIDDIPFRFPFLKPIDSFFIPTITTTSLSCK